MAALFYRIAKRPAGGGRQYLFTQEKELAVVNLVRANNATRLHQLQQQILVDTQVFNNINRVSISTVRHILVQQNMKHLYRVPFQRNSVRVKELPHKYIQVSVLYIYNAFTIYSESYNMYFLLQRILEMDGADQPHECIYTDLK